jgi:hypothetical protein
MICRVRQKAVLQEIRETKHKTPCSQQRDERIVLKRSPAKGRLSHLTMISKSKLCLQCSAFSPPLSITACGSPCGVPIILHGPIGNLCASHRKEADELSSSSPCLAFGLTLFHCFFALFLRGLMTIERRRAHETCAQPERCRRGKILRREV